MIQSFGSEEIIGVDKIVNTNTIKKFVGEVIEQQNGKEKQGLLNGNIPFSSIMKTSDKGGLHLGKPSQIWISPN